MVVTDRPLVEYTPLHRPTRGAEEGLPVTQYPMDVLEDTGLLKVDFLGLATITVGNGWGSYRLTLAITGRIKTARIT